MVENYQDAQFAGVNSKKVAPQGKNLRSTNFSERASVSKIDMALDRPEKMEMFMEAKAKWERVEIRKRQLEEAGYMNYEDQK